MDPWPVIAIALAIGFVVALAAHRRADVTLRRVRSLSGVGAEGDPVYGVEQLRADNARLERDLADQAHDRQFLADLVDIAVVDLDPQLEVVYANAAAHALVDRAPGMLLGLDLLEVFLDPQIEALARTALDQGNASGEVRLRGADGPALLVRARRSTAGGVWLVLADVSELRRLQQIRAEFIDNLSHELRTPLTTVGLLAETLSRDADAAGDGDPARRCATGSPRSRSRPATSSRWSARSWISRGSRAAQASRSSTTSISAGWRRPRPNGCASSPSGRA